MPSERDVSVHFPDGSRIYPSARARDLPWQTPHFELDLRRPHAKLWPEHRIVQVEARSLGRAIERFARDGYIELRCWCGRAIDGVRFDVELRGLMTHQGERSCCSAHEGEFDDAAGAERQCDLTLQWLVTGALNRRLHVPDGFQG